MPNKYEASEILKNQKDLFEIWFYINDELYKVLTLDIDKNVLYYQSEENSIGTFEFNFEQKFTKRTSIKIVEIYKNHKIYLDGTAYFTTEIKDWKNKYRYYIALDDSKSCGYKKWIESANNIESARNYIDWITKEK